MRFLLAVAVGWALLLPLPAAAANPAECARMMKQIEHFQGMQKRAEELENEMWAGRMEAHVALLRDRFDARCPEFGRDDRALKEALHAFSELLKVAAKGAATFFTMGAF